MWISGFKPVCGTLGLSPDSFAPPPPLETGGGLDDAPPPPPAEGPLDFEGLLDPPPPDVALVRPGVGTRFIGDRVFDLPLALLPPTLFLLFLLLLEELLPTF